MEETPQSKHGDRAVKELGHAGAVAVAGPDSMQTSMKRKQSTSRGEVASSTDPADISPLKSQTGDSLEPNKATQGPSAIIGQRKWPALENCPGLTTLRMLIPSRRDDTIKIDLDKMKSIAGENIQVFIQVVAGVEIVTVKAKEDLHPPTSPAVKGFVRIHKDLVDSSAFSMSGFCSTKLLVQAEQAKCFIFSSTFQTIQEEHQCGLVVYLTDNLSKFLSVGDVIIELIGEPYCVNKAVEDVATKLRSFPFRESTGCELEKSHETYGNVSRLNGVRIIKCSHFTRFPLSYVAHIIGDDGANIKKIQEKNLVTIKISPLTSDVVLMNIEGDHLTAVEEAEKCMEDSIPNQASQVFEDVEEDIVDEAYVAMYMSSSSGEVWI